MSFTKWANSKMKKIDVWDMTCIKLACMVFGLLIAKLWIPILNWEWYWYLIIVILLALRPWYRVYLK